MSLQTDRMKKRFFLDLFDPGKSFVEIQTHVALNFICIDVNSATTVTKIVPFMN